MKKLAIVTTHPVQYYAPVFKLLNERKGLIIKVFYTWGKNSAAKYDPGFDKIIEWDIPLLDGYPYEWVINTAKDPGTHHFGGIANPDLINDLKQMGPDAILVYGWAFKSHLKVIRYFKNKTLVYFRGDSTLLDEKHGVKSLLRGFFLKWVYKHIDYAFFVGANNKNYYLKFGLKNNQLQFAPHSVDNDRFGIEKTEEAISLRQQLHLKNEEILILFAGKLGAKKAPLQLLEAFKSLARNDVHLLYIGNGPLEEELKMNPEQNSNVHFMDFQNQSYMPTAYQACDIFCLPSIGPNETWGLAINEAMACAKAILTSDKAGAAIDLVKTGVNGSVFKAGDTSDLKHHLNLLLKHNRYELKKMGEKSKEIIKNWHFEIQVNAIASFIENERKTAI